MSGLWRLLTTYGPQDLMLIGNPQITFFNPTYTPHTNYYQEYDFEQEITDIKNICKYSLFTVLDKYAQHQCPICLDDYDMDDDIVLQNCEHIYHQDCDSHTILKCPICNQ